MGTLVAVDWEKEPELFWLMLLGVCVLVLLPMRWILKDPRRASRIFGLVKDPTSKKWKLDPNKKHWGYALLVLVQAIFWAIIFARFSLIEGEGGFIIASGLTLGIGLFWVAGLLREEGFIAKVCIYVGGFFAVAGMILGVLWLGSHYQGPCQVDPTSGPWFC